jgi:hypothetical protein
MYWSFESLSHPPSLTDSLLRCFCFNLGNHTSAPSKEDLGLKVAGAVSSGNEKREEKEEDDKKKNVGFQVMNQPKIDVERNEREEEKKIQRTGKGSKNGRKEDVQKGSGEKIAQNKV